MLIAKIYNDLSAAPTYSTEANNLEQIFEKLNKSGWVFSFAEENLTFYEDKTFSYYEKKEIDGEEFHLLINFEN